jgi:hypothetical protein
MQERFRMHHAGDGDLSDIVGGGSARLMPTTKDPL